MREKQVQKGGEMILTQAAEEKSSTSAIETKANKGGGTTKKSGLNKSLKR